MTSLDPTLLLRRTLREKRSTLPLKEQQAASHALAFWFDDIPALLTATHVAGYCAIAGEISPLPLLLRCLEENKRCYLPVIDNTKERHMSFCPFTLNTPLFPGPFDIPAPAFDQETMIDSAALDVVFVPLIGFDRRGHRLGCGGGYYDQSFAFKNPAQSSLTTQGTRAPLLIGLAYEFQELNTLEAAPWDIPMDLILTPDGIIYPQR